MTAIKLDREDTLSNMEKSGLFVNKQDEIHDYCRTPLHVAAETGNVKAVRKLLALGAQPSVLLKDEEGCTPLELALDSSHADIAKILRDEADKLSNLGKS